MEDEMYLSENLDVEILMHRDIHFGGLFDWMVQAYQQERKGTFDHFPIERILYLQEQENAMQVNLAAYLLGPAEMERVVKAKVAYARLRDLYEQKHASPDLLLMADLILSEEEEPVQQMDALVQRGSAMVPSLIEVLKSSDSYDPLLPGFGLAPGFVALCLGRIGDERAIIPLFEALGCGEFEIEEKILQALRLMQEKARPFLHRVLKSRPITEDNERAALVLAALDPHPETARACFDELCHCNCETHAAYLIASCHALEGASLKNKFIQMAASASKELKEEFYFVTKSWQ